MLELINDGIAPQFAIELTGEGQVPVGGGIAFVKGTLSGEVSTAPTSLEFGPDGRLYVARVNGLIDVYTVTRTEAGIYNAAATETISLIQSIPNHNDDGTAAPNSSRLLTGLLVGGTPEAPVIYAGSTDPRFGAGPSGSDTGLDTNSGIISKITWSGHDWVRTDLVRGLPRSEENHSLNGMVLLEESSTLLVAVGGHTNKGAPSNNFAELPEYALSAAVIAIDLDAIGTTTYDLPTLDDDSRPGIVDANDPFGGNDGRNQAVIVPGGPVQVYSPGWRNAYDLVVTSGGAMYAVDNGGNSGWGGVPIGEGPSGLCANELNDTGDSDPDALIRITGPGFYAGHPNPTRGNRANTFNELNPQSPVPVANPVECDYLDVSVDRPHIASFGASTNGIADYTSSSLDGQLTGDLLIASFDNSIKRVKLDGAGSAAVLVESLFSNVGSSPLDVTTQGDGEAFPGTIWVADYVSGSIIVFEPDEELACIGEDSPALDEDGDGYDNADELANGTDPCSGADRPADADADFESDLLDLDDDNDGIPDTSDPFALDPLNGLATTVPVELTWENDAPDEGGLLGLGFTGLMTNGTVDYRSVFDPAQMTVGGAAGVVTIDQVPSGTARGAANDQWYGFQLGLNASAEVVPFTVSSRLSAPYAGATPSPGQEMGLMVGAGDQSNYAQVVVAGSQGGRIEFVVESADQTVTAESAPLAMPGPGSVDLQLRIDPVGQTMQASYVVDDAVAVDLGPPVAVPPGWISSGSGLAVGLIATAPAGSPDLPASWDELTVTRDQVAAATHAAEVEITPSGTINASTFATGSFRVWNRSAGGERIAQIQIDLSKAAMPDLVFDPLGQAGDTAAKDFTPDGAIGTISVSSHALVGLHDDGFDKLVVSTTDFDPGERMTFSIDIDPTSIRGSTAPGPSDSGSVSGLELAGAEVTIIFTDGVTLVNNLGGVPGQPAGSFARLDAEVAPAPVVELLGMATPGSVEVAEQILRVTGTPGATVRIQVLEAALFTPPGGGFDIDPLEANSVIAIADVTASIGPSGTVDLPLVLTATGPTAGINHVIAAELDSGNATGRTSHLLVRLD